MMMMMMMMMMTRRMELMLVLVLVAGMPALMFDGWVMAVVLDPIMKEVDMPPLHWTKKQQQW